MISSEGTLIAQNWKFIRVPKVLLPLSTTVNKIEYILFREVPSIRIKSLSLAEGANWIVSTIKILCIHHSIDVKISEL